MAVALGAGVTVILATLTGFPISHDPCSDWRDGRQRLGCRGVKVNLGILGKAFFLPLLLSPVLAMILGATLYLMFRWSRLRMGITKEWCISDWRRTKSYTYAPTFISFDHTDRDTDAVNMC